MSVFTTTKNIQNLVVPFRSGHKLGEGPEVTAGEKYHFLASFTIQINKSCLQIPFL